MRKIKVLIQMRDLRVGSGITTCIMGYYRRLVQDGFTVDFLLNRDIPSEYSSLARMEKSHIYILPKDTNKPSIRNYNYIKKVINSDYDIIHVNISGLNAIFSLFLAKRYGIPVRLYHGHSILEKDTIKARIRSKLYVKNSIAMANSYAACSKLAGDSLFGDRNYYVIKNIFDIDKFKYDIEVRKKKRSELNIEDNIVIGSVGRLVDSKNPFFTLEIFRSVLKINNKCVLIWAGDGELKKDVQEKINQMGLEKKIKLLGNVEDVSNLYSAMDIFLLPTKFEGLGLVFLEAQASGLICFSSDQIPDDVLLTRGIHTLSLARTPEEWAREISKYFFYERTDEREYIKNAGFDRTTDDGSISEMYLKLIQLKGRNIRNI